MGTLEAATIAALSGAFLGAVVSAVASYLLRRWEQRSSQRSELVGILQLLSVETAHNANLLEEFGENPGRATDAYRSTLRSDVWEETRVRLSQLLPLLGDRTLLADLAEYYE